MILNIIVIINLKENWLSYKSQVFVLIICFKKDKLFIDAERKPMKKKLEIRLEKKTEKTTTIKWQTGLDMKGKTQQIQGVESIRS